MSFWKTVIGGEWGEHICNLIIFYSIFMVVIAKTRMDLKHKHDAIKMFAIEQKWSKISHLSSSLFKFNLKIGFCLIAFLSLPFLCSAWCRFNICSVMLLFVFYCQESLKETLYETTEFPTTWRNYFMINKTIINVQFWKSFQGIIILSFFFILKVTLHGNKLEIWHLSTIKWDYNLKDIG